MRSHTNRRYVITFWYLVIAVTLILLIALYDVGTSATLGPFEH